ncbi:MAG: glutamate formimidoyltransferase [Bryobacterales bacterium]|nr:glutamate formimidoyltransferase [Bryobacterales bacterium]
MTQLAECVPNFSEGRDPTTLDRLEHVIRVSGARLLDRHSDHDHHRSVLTFAADLGVIYTAVMAAAGEAVKSIDLNGHDGTHPRVGAIDVVPIVPLHDTPWAACVDVARSIGERLWSELGLPVYLYGRAAVREERRPLETVRKLGFERLAELVQSGQYLPDIGGPRLHPSAGACCVGVRGPLVAYNVLLGCCDARPAKVIASRIRAASGGFPGVKALGMYLESAQVAQVSMNITQPDLTPLPLVFDEVSRIATGLGVEVVASELVGLVPRAALGADPSRLRIVGFHDRMILEERLGGGP